jgi:hypothetical protein
MGSLPAERYLTYVGLRSRSLLASVSAARALDLLRWALTGLMPNPLAGACDDHLAVSADPANVQECHLVAVHLPCAAVDEALAPSGRSVGEALSPAAAVAHKPVATTDRPLRHATKPGVA